jgi:hypothetical protein
MFGSELRQDGHDQTPATELEAQRLEVFSAHESLYAT